LLAGDTTEFIKEEKWKMESTDLIVSGVKVNKVRKEYQEWATNWPQE
jgi:hypothetical protein